MASAYSILHNYQQDLYTPNFELISSALQYKQQSLNANRQKLQTLRDQFSFLDVAKEQDQEYLENRLQTVTDEVNKYSALDLSSNYLTDQLVDNMGSVIDDRVKNAVVSTRIYQSEQAAWSKLREDNPEKYSQVNHAYASQAPNAWLNDEQIGSKYRGGGGVIEYQDVQGKLSEKIPEIAKNLKAEWVELSGGGGYFRDVVTKERVSRGALETAMDGLLNEQDKRQLQINAWGQYDNMTDEQLESVYTKHFSPKIESLESNIKSLQGVISSTDDPALKEQRGELLSFYQDQLKTIQENDFRNITSKYGREAAYQSLYDNQFRSNYLDTYSYADRITKIATYDNDVETRNHEYKLANLKRMESNELFDRQIKLRELELKELEASGAGNSSTAKPGDPGYVPPIQGEVTTGYEDAIPKIQQHFEKEQKILKDTQNLFGVDNLVDTRELAKVFNEGFAGKEFIEFKGKKINVQENLSLLLDYKNNILNQSPAEKEAFIQLSSSLDKSLNSIRRIAQGDNPDWDAYSSTPRFNFRFTKDEETGTMRRVEIRGENFNNYAQLLEKEVLTEAEEYTLGVYYRMHTMMDPSIDDNQRNVLFQDLTVNQFSKLPNEELEKFPNSASSFKRLGRGSIEDYTPIEFSLSKEVVVQMEKDGFAEDYKDFFQFSLGGSMTGKIQMTTEKGYGDVSRKIIGTYQKYVDAPEVSKSKYIKKLSELKRTLDNDKSLVSGGPSLFMGLYQTSDYYLSDISAKDAEFYDSNGEEVSIRSPQSLINEGINLYASTLESEFKDQELEPTLYKQIFTPDVSGYSKLTALVGLPSDSKVPITIERVWDEESKKPSEGGEVNWYYDTKIKGEPTRISSEMSGNMLDVDDLRNNGIIDFAAPTRSVYDASWGENASVLDLGNVKQYDRKIRERNVTRYGNNLAMLVENVRPLVEDALKFGGEELANEIKSERNAFNNGKYSFKMESIGGIWQYSIYSNSGERVYSEPTDASGVSKYSVQEITGIVDNSEFTINTVMYNYLLSKVEDASEEFLLNLQEEQNL